MGNYQWIDHVINLILHSTIKNDEISFENCTTFNQTFEQIISKLLPIIPTAQCNIDLPINQDPSIHAKEVNKHIIKV